MVIEGRRPTPLTVRADGLFELALPGVGPGTRYQYRLDGERYRPDPASRHQPEGVHGTSVVVDGAGVAWTDQAFRGHELADLVFYELHVGTFTAAGTFEAVIPHLPELVRARDHRDRADAGRRVSRARATGATTASTCMRRSPPMVDRAACGAWSTRPTAWA